jgi:hypothetical protein
LLRLSQSPFCKHFVIFCILSKYLILHISLPGRLSTVDMRRLTNKEASHSEGGT